MTIISMKWIAWRELSGYGKDMLAIIQKPIRE